MTAVVDHQIYYGRGRRQGINTDRIGGTGAARRTLVERGGPGKRTVVPLPGREVTLDTSAHGSVRAPMLCDALTLARCRRGRIRPVVADASGEDRSPAADHPDLRASGVPHCVVNGLLNTRKHWRRWSAPIRTAQTGSGAWKASAMAARQHVRGETAHPGRQVLQAIVARVDRPDDFAHGVDELAGNRGDA